MDPTTARARLLDLKNRLTARRQRIERHIHRRDEPLAADSGDRAIELENRETLECLDDEAQAELRQIEHAIARIDTGGYGRCETCRRRIGAARLAVVPFATQCVACAGRS